MTNKKADSNSKSILLFLASLMIIIGINDSLRGIFLPIFQDTMQLTPSQVSMIVSVGYIGNVLFLLVGGYLLDRYGRKRILLATLLVWLSSLLIFLLTSSYELLLIGMILSAGASILMNTTISIIGPIIFISAPVMISNILSFTQGLGMSVSQNRVGSYANTFMHWQGMNRILFILGIGVLLVLLNLKIPNESKDEICQKVSYKEILSNKAFPFFVIMLGFYIIADHSVMNWLVLYGTEELQMRPDVIAKYVSLFYLGITIGRLLFAPIVNKLGSMKSIGIFSIVAGVLYIIGITFARKYIILLSLSGLFFSILYPTLIFMIRSFFPSHMIATATGVIVSFGMMFSVIFNAMFGKIIEWIGFNNSILILPLMMIGFIVVFFIFYNNNSEEIKTGRAIIAR